MGGGDDALYGARDFRWLACYSPLFVNATAPLRSECESFFAAFVFIFFVIFLDATIRWGVCPRPLLSVLPSSFFVSLWQARTAFGVNISQYDRRHMVVLLV